MYISSVGIEIIEGGLYMSARDNLIKEYVYSGWEKDKVKSLQFMGFIDHLDDENKVSKLSIELIRSGVVDTLITEEKYDWLNLRWVDDTIYRLLSKYTKKEIEAHIYKVKQYGEYEESYNYENLKRYLGD